MPPRCLVASSPNAFRDQVIIAKILGYVSSIEFHPPVCDAHIIWLTNSRADGKSASKETKKKTKKTNNQSVAQTIPSLAQFHLKKFPHVEEVAKARPNNYANTISAGCQSFHIGKLPCTYSYQLYDFFIRRLM